MKDQFYWMLMEVSELIQNNPIILQLPFSELYKRAPTEALKVIVYYATFKTMQAQYALSNQHAKPKLDDLINLLVQDYIKDCPNYVKQLSDYCDS